jgi:hypothetical protein
MPSEPMTKSFECFRDLGLDTDIYFCQIHEGGTKLIRVSHCEYDGISGFVNLLKKQGQYKSDGFPNVLRRNRHSIALVYRKLREYIRTLGQFKMKSYHWRYGEGFQLKRQFFSVVSFEVESTRRLKAQARRLKVSVNSFLFHHLAASVMPYLDFSRDAAGATWIVPASLYESEEQAHRKGNRTSIMEVVVKPDQSVRETHEMIKAEVRREAHWGPWLGAWIFYFLPRFFVRWALKSTVAKKKRVGTFSNLGSWIGVDHSDWWTGMPPVHPGQPFGVAAIEWNGKLALGFRVHESAGLTKETLDTLIVDWFARLGVAGRKYHLDVPL